MSLESNLTDDQRAFSSAFNEAAGGDPLDFAVSEEPEEKPEEEPVSEGVSQKDEADPSLEAEEQPSGEEEQPSEGETTVSGSEEGGEEGEEDISAVYKRLQNFVPGSTPLDKGGETPQDDGEDAGRPEDPAASEDAEQLAAIRKDWPEIDRLLQAEIQRVRVEGRAEAQRLVKEAVEAVRREMAPVIASTQTMTQNQFMATVTTAHPDFQQLAHPILRWIDKQPDYLKAAYVQAFHSPNPQDAIDLITRFKSETGRVRENPTPERKEEKKEKLKLLKQPGSRRTGVIDSADPLDYEGAFREAAERFDKTGT